MVDEVQTGLGRCGAWFALQHLGVQPDVVTMAKALGNGMPIGACWARAEVAAAFEPGDHGTTYGGQPLAAAAARAVLAGHGGRGRAGRGRSAPEPACPSGLDRAPGVSTRCAGSGCCSPSSSTAATPRSSTRRLLELGVIVNAVTPTALRLAPSLLITDDEIDAAIARFAEALA